MEDNLAGLRTLAAQAEAIDAALASARRSAELADKLYRAGRSGYLDVLDAQRNLAVIERAAVQLRGARRHHGGAGARAGRRLAMNINSAAR